MSIHIYILKDPITKDIMYIGFSSNPEKHIKRIIRERYQIPNKNLSSWFNALLTTNAKPIIEPIHKVRSEGSARRYIFSYYKKNGTPVLNRNTNYEATAEKIKENWKTPLRHQKGSIARTLYLENLANSLYQELIQLPEYHASSDSLMDIRK